MEKAKGIDNNTIIEGVKFSGGYVGALQVLAMYLQSPEEMYNLAKDHKEDYDYLIEPVFILLNDINVIIKEKNLAVDIEVPKEE